MGAPARVATNPDLKGIAGRSFVDRQIVGTAEHTTDQGRCDRLWETRARLVGLTVAAPLISQSRPAQLIFPITRRETRMPGPSRTASQ